MPERQEGRGGGRRGRRPPRLDQVQISISRPSERAGKLRRENDDVMYAAEAKFYLGQLTSSFKLDQGGTKSFQGDVPILHKS